jgi:hypothetical protein
MTVSSTVRLSLPKLGRDLAERDECEIARLLARDPSLVVGFGETAAGEALNYARGLAAMLIECGIEGAVISNGRKPSARPNLIGQGPAEGSVTPENAPNKLSSD